MRMLGLVFPRAEEARRFIAYGLASVVALAIDVAIFLALMRAGISPGIAAAGGYASGIAAHWLMSTRIVFSDRIAHDGGRLAQQRALFVLSALVGLAINYGIVQIGSGAGFDPRIAKLAAIGTGFFVTWLIREKIVFGPKDRHSA